MWYLISVMIGVFIGVYARDKQIRINVNGFLNTVRLYLKSLMERRKKIKELESELEQLKTRHSFTTHFK